MPPPNCTTSLICALAGAVRIAVLLGLTAHVLSPRGVAAQTNIESQDYIEGPKAFAERRKPEWQNR